MNRWAAIAAAVIGGAAAALATTMGVFGALLGFLWIFVFGDDPWPAWVEPVVGMLIPLFGLAAWAVSGWLIWRQLTAIRPKG